MISKCTQEEIKLHLAVELLGWLICWLAGRITNYILARLRVLHSGSAALASAQLSRHKATAGGRHIPVLIKLQIIVR